MLCVVSIQLLSVPWRIYFVRRASRAAVGQLSDWNIMWQKAVFSSRFYLSSLHPSVRPSVRCRSTLSKPWRSETAVPMSMKLVVCILRSGDKTSWSEILNFGPCAERDHPELSSVGTAPLIRSRPWRFINLFTYLVSYLDDPPRRGVLIFYRYTFVIF